MAKVNLATGTIVLEGGDVATVALMAGMMACITPAPVGEPDITPADCARAATRLYREVIQEVFHVNEEPSALDLLEKIWTILPEDGTERPLGEALTEELAQFLIRQNRL